MACTTMGAYPYGIHKIFFWFKNYDDVVSQLFQPSSSEVSETKQTSFKNAKVSRILLLTFQYRVNHGQCIPAKI